MGGLSVSRMRYAVVLLVALAIFVTFSRPAAKPRPPPGSNQANGTLVLPLERPAIHVKRSDSLSSDGANTTGSVTIGINKFLGEQSTLKLIDSIRTYYPDVKINVADSSAPSDDWSRGLHNVDVYHLPFDAGAAAGRNLLLMVAKTKYVLLLDDDFVFTSDTRLEPALAVMAGSDYDILGGRIWTGSSWLTNNYLLWEETKSRGHPVIIKCTDLFYFRHPVPGASSDGEEWEVFDTDAVSPFMLARRDKVATVLYDVNFKLGEQSDFFFRAKGKLKIGYTPQLTVNHEKRPTDRLYKRFRDRYGPRASPNNTFVRYMRLKWGGYPYISLEYPATSCPVTNQTLIASQKKPLRDHWPVGKYIVMGDNRIFTANLTRGGEVPEHIFQLSMYSPEVDGATDATMITFRDVFPDITLHIVSCDHVGVATQWLKTADVRHFLLPKSECNPDTGLRVLFSQQQHYLMLNVAPGLVPTLNGTASVALTVEDLEEAARLVRNPSCGKAVAKPFLPLRFLDKLWSDNAYINYPKVGAPKVAQYVLDFNRHRLHDYYVPTTNKEANMWMCWDRRDPKAPELPKKP